VDENVAAVSRLCLCRLPPYYNERMLQFSVIFDFAPSSREELQGLFSEKSNRIAATNTGIRTHQGNLSITVSVRKKGFCPVQRSKSLLRTPLLVRGTNTCTNSLENDLSTSKKQRLKKAERIAMLKGIGKIRSCSIGRIQIYRDIENWRPYKTPHSRRRCNT
jgi:hypothetical protein